MYLTNPLCYKQYVARRQFLRKYSWFEFKVVCYLDWLPKVLVFPYNFTHSWKGKRWIHAFPKNISAK